MAGLQMGPLYYFATYSNMVSANHYEGLKTSPFLEAILVDKQTGAKFSLVRLLELDFLAVYWVDKTALFTLA
jgi:hypothetical protein